MIIVVTSKALVQETSVGRYGCNLNLLYFRSNWSL